MLRALDHVARSRAAPAAIGCLLAAMLAIAPRATAQQNDAQPAASTPANIAPVDEPIELFPSAARSHEDLLFQPGQSLGGFNADDKHPAAANQPQPQPLANAPAQLEPPPAMPAAEPYVPPLVMPGGRGPMPAAPVQPVPQPGEPHLLPVRAPVVMVPQGVHPAAHHLHPFAGHERSALAGGPVAMPQAMPISAAFMARQEELPFPGDGPIEPLEEQGEIVLTEEPGQMMGPACFDCPRCGGPGCYPGRKHCCSVCTARTRWGRFWCAIYETICCPDPCWDPTFLYIADSAFFVPGARPTTHVRFRWDAGFSMVFPDRAEYFWAQADGSGLGPQPVPPYKGERGLDYDELSMYTEAAVNNFAMTFEVPYRSVDPLDGSIEAGFSDMIIGTKSLVFDRELFQITFQFRTFMPSGNTLEGLGTGHVSLEPSLILGFKISPESYLQAQLAEWIPIGGSKFAGSILHYHISYNRTLIHLLPDVPVVGTLEFNGWSFQDGSYTDPYTGPQQANDFTYAAGAVGLRMFVCDNLDMGMSGNFALNTPNWTRELYRLEFRMRY